MSMNYVKFFVFFLLLFYAFTHPVVGQIQYILIVIVTDEFTKLGSKNDFMKIFNHMLIIYRNIFFYLAV